MAGWEIETLEGVMSTAEGGVYNVISREAVESLLADKGALKLLSEHGYEITPYINDAGEVVGHVIRTAASSNGATTAVSNTVQVLVKEQVVDQAMIDSVASGSIGTAADVGALNIGETVSEVTLTGGGAGVGGTALATVAGPAIAVGLGVATGVVMYNIAPEFWTKVSDKLVAAGKTIGGKVISFFDKDGKTYYDEDTINIIKEELIKAGYLGDGSPNDTAPETTLSQAQQKAAYDRAVSFMETLVTFPSDTFTKYPEPTTFNAPYGFVVQYEYGVESFKNEKNWQIFGLNSHKENFNPWASDSKGSYIRFNDGKIINYPASIPNVYINTSKVCCLAIQSIDGIIKPNYSNLVSHECSNGSSGAFVNRGEGSKVIAQAYNWYFAVEDDSKPTPKPLPSEDARTVPTGEPTDKTDEEDDKKKKVYPFPFPSSLPDPDNNDDPASDPSDNHDPDPTPDDDDRSNPKEDPNDKPKDEPEDKPSPNPDPNHPENDPTDDEPKDPDDPNPKDPDDGKTPDPPFPIVPSAGLGNIYNPTRGQVEALQSYLWSSTNLVDIMKVFQNPVDGIISLHWVFGTPIQGGSKEITLGYLPTGVSAPTVANQFIDVDCGTISIPLKQKNALDYPPYTDIQIYLPFIGIQPLNAYDLVGGTLNVKYRIDAYTGACVAKLTATRGGLSAKLYEFAGNCGYELPLTSGNFIGMVGNVVSGVVMGALTGGVAGAAVGAMGSTIHSNLNVSRSGNLSANAGICGSRNPYIIITRAVPYDAANYNQFYGYPSNKTVYLSNCKGFTKVKEIILHTSATQAEKEEIEALLKEGVYL